MTQSKGIGRGGARPGAGRKPKLSPEQVSISARVEQSLLDRLAALAESRGLELSEFIRRALAGYCTELEARDRRNGGK